MNIVCWNINGIRACLKKGLLEFIKTNAADIYLFQETKIQTKDMEQLCLQLAMFLPEYTFHFTCSEGKKGYSGVLTMSKVPTKSITYGINYLPIDIEGRIITTELDGVVIINAYVPNSGPNLERLGYRNTFNTKLRNFIAEQSKPVILAGDLNVIHQEIDAWNFKANVNRCNGFMPDERNWLTNLLNEGYIDVYRSAFPKQQGYTWYHAGMDPRIIEKGWRLDYFIADKNLENKIDSTYIDPHTYGSDHVPIFLELT